MSTSVTTHSDQEKMHAKNFHNRHDSGELDVFEAAGYFSGYNEVIGTAFPQKGTRGRISLDMPINRNTAQIQPNNNGLIADDKQTFVKEINKKYKQPSSPGGKLASFLNSLFNQNALKKKKPKSLVTTKSMKDHPINNVDVDDLRKKRRSSISHFTSSASSINTTTTATTNTNDSSKSFYYSSSSSGFRTPPPIYANTPTKGYFKDLRSYSKKSNVTLDDDKFKFSNSIRPILESNGKLLGHKDKFEKKQNWVVDKCSPKEEDQKEFKVFAKTADDDGVESDSSSDLFELQNCELLGSFSSGNLPVYETTNLDHLKKPISNGIIL